MFKIKTKKQGFTLIELLVVIAIIGILSTLAVAALQNARKNARDAKRIVDIRQIQTALELYYSDVGEYPADVTSSITYGSNVYMATYPTAPTPADGDCSSDANIYTYTQQNSGASYTINFCLGGQTGGLIAGTKQATPGGIITPLPCGGETQITDSRDSTVYPIVEIGTQCWFAKNLAYLPSVTGPNAQWNSTEPRYAVYNYTDSANLVAAAKANANYSTYGVLYNFPAVIQTGANAICPTGWSVPTDAQWTIMNEYLDPGNYVDWDTLGWCNSTPDDCGGHWPNAGGKMKQTGTTYWTTPNTGATNNSGFTALSAGLRSTYGSFVDLGYGALFWSSSVLGTDVWSRNLNYNNAEVRRNSNYDQADGFSVRCLKN
jgi:uncharacterized protein (TIGR02145 family)/prepilin-type N-terminal cleavage/methylation domain-containing protein